MKKVLLFTTACICSSILSAQYIYKIKADSVLITNDSCTAELIIENSTKHVLGFLYNKGNGRTEFRTGSAIGDFILNQNSSDQSASFRISGSGQVGNTFRFGNLSSDPTGNNGMIYYNSSTHKYRGFINSAWSDFLTFGDLIASNGVSYFFDNIYTNKWNFRLGEAYNGSGEPNPGSSRLLYPTVIPMNGYVLTFLNGDNNPGDGADYTHIMPNRGITLGNYQNIPTGSLLRVGSFAGASKGSWYNAETTDITPNELVHIYSSPSAFAGTNGTEGKGLFIDLDMGATVGNFYGSKKPIGEDIYLRSNSNYNAFYNGDWIGLRLKSVSWNESVTPRTKMYTLWADSGRAYFSDSVMIGTTSPRAKFTIDGTASFNLGSDAAGDVFYRNSSGLMTPLPIGSTGQTLTVQSGLPTWTNDKIKTTATLDFASTGSLSSSTINVTVTGAAVGDHVLISKADGTSSNGELYIGTVSATNTVTIRFQNVSGSSVDLSSASYNIIVIKF